MRISSKDAMSYIEIRRVEENDWPSFHVEAGVVVACASFSATNIDVALFKLKEFASEFEKFTLNRKGKPKLEGTYDTYLTFSSIDRHVIVEFSVGAYDSAPYMLKGSFEIEEDSLYSLRSAFQELSEKS